MEGFQIGKVAATDTKRAKWKDERHKWVPHEDNMCTRAKVYSTAKTLALQLQLTFHWEWDQ
jgi:hypothetical protein